MKLFSKVALLLLCVVLVVSLFSMSNFADSLLRKPVLVIDPGHGGIDGGAVGIDDTPEKNINLSIALKLRDTAVNNGWRVVMTRETDESLGIGEPTIRSQKMKDLVVRKKIIDESGAAAAVSIHLNSFPQDRSCAGAQTFYPSDQETPLREQSKLLAESIQAQLTSGLQVQKERNVAKKSKVYIFKQPKLPVVLVECGFLSSPDEAKMLQDDQYQYQLAVCIFKGLDDYYRQINGKNSTLPIENIIISEINDSSTQDINTGE